MVALTSIQLPRPNAHFIFNKSKVASKALPRMSISSTSPQPIHRYIHTFIHSLFSFNLITIHIHICQMNFIIGFSLKLIGFWWQKTFSSFSSSSQSNSIWHRWNVVWLRSHSLLCFPWDASRGFSLTNSQIINRQFFHDNLIWQGWLLHCTGRFQWWNCYKWRVLC